ncbi:MAG: HD domain-containing protein [Lachnospiraceae bacterium]|nr:HD domain-containing protein [Lachnospiraceae bacterium]
MKKLPTAQLSPGMVVGSDVLSYDNRIIISQGQELSETLITRLELYGILSVYIEEESLPEGEEPSYLSRVRSSPLFQEFQTEFDEQTASLKFAVSEMVEKNVEIDPRTLLEGPLAMIQKAGSSGTVLDMLHIMRANDDVTFAHCMNVALLNYILAGWLGWSEEEQQTAMLCGLLFDVGKLKTPKEILNKPAALTDPEKASMHQHAEQGYRVLKNQPVDAHVQNTALMHHERCDGSGYPMKILREQIDPYARLTAITDVYDAMTSKRVYRDALSPFLVIEEFEKEGLEKYDPDMILTFLKNVAYTYIQNDCILSDGREGTVIMLNPQRFSRPVVQCGKEYIDLMKERNLRIQRLI